MSIVLGRWNFNKEMLSMAAAILMWIAYQSYSIAEWKTHADDTLKQLLMQVQSISDYQTRLLPEHEHRLTVVETQIPAIKQGVDGLDRKLDIVIEKLSKGVQP